MEDRQWIVGSKEETGLKPRVMPKIQQHLQSMRLGEGGNVGHEAVTAGMSRDDGHSFFQCRAEPIGISERLVLADQTEFVADMTQEE